MMMGGFGLFLDPGGRPRGRLPVILPLALPPGPASTTSRPPADWTSAWPSSSLGWLLLPLLLVVVSSWSLLLKWKLRWSSALLVLRGWREGAEVAEVTPGLAPPTAAAPVHHQFASSSVKSISAAFPFLLVAYLRSGDMKETESNLYSSQRWKLEREST
ncbi:hypothetical protein OPV22_032798 [Ensete ventricosum]|uniref:Uncharacterized protein n=1 Tax=Ensete ventricosum TaxID=4639 RepID=A0AAV8PNJ7_ENSVE|nr:hypothetical protein OPV22_032798 [Ensete ventricosum]